MQVDHLPRDVGALRAVEPDEHLVEDDLVQDRHAAAPAKAIREQRGKTAAALDELGQPRSAERLQHGVDRHAARPA